MSGRVIHDDHEDIPRDEVPAEPTDPEVSDLDVLDRLRLGPPSVALAKPSVERVSRELQHRTDPDRVVPVRPLDLPWSERAKVRARARSASHEARLGIFKDDLRSIRIANEVLNRAATLRAVEAAEIAIFEIRNLGETTRLTILNRAQLDMTRQFIGQLGQIEGFRGRLTDEVLDALKERALTEFTERMNRVSKADLEFNRADILRVRT